MSSGDGSFSAVSVLSVDARARARRHPDSQELPLFSKHSAIRVATTLGDGGAGSWSLRARPVPPPHLPSWPAPELLALVGVSISMAVSAIIPVEALCDSPGIGQLVWLSASARDLPVLVHLTVLIALVTCVANLVSDTAGTLLSGEAT